MEVEWRCKGCGQTWKASAETNVEWYEAITCTCAIGAEPEFEILPERALK